MFAFKATKKQRLITIIGISFTFFIAEISIGFYTKSLALVADAFHYMNDLLGFAAALAAILVSERETAPEKLSFGWQRAQLLGAFFNGVFLLALGVSIFLQSIERFISLQEVQNPKLVLIVGCVGLTLNIISATILHEHDNDESPAASGHTNSNTEQADEQAERGHDQPDPTFAHVEHRHVIVALSTGGKDLGLLGVMIHVIGDAINNIGVIIAALVIWKAHYGGRFYADPGVSMGIAILICASAYPLMKNSGAILLQTAPKGVLHADVKHDLETIPDFQNVHDLHIWMLDQKKVIATAHVGVTSESLPEFMANARTARECLHAYGIHSVTLQPELVQPGDKPGAATGNDAQRDARRADCQISCQSNCEHLICCTD